MSVSKAQISSQMPRLWLPSKEQTAILREESVPKNLRAYLRAAHPDGDPQLFPQHHGRSHARLSNPSYSLAKFALLSFRSWVSAWTALHGSVSVRMGIPWGRHCSCSVCQPTLLSSPLPCWVTCVLCLMAQSSHTKGALEHTLLAGSFWRFSKQQIQTWETGPRGSKYSFFFCTSKASLPAGPPRLEEIKTSPDSRLCGHLGGSDHTLSPLLLSSACRETPTPVVSSREDVGICSLNCMWEEGVISL